MQAKLVITLSDGTIVEKDNVEHKVNMAGDLVLPCGASYPSYKWKDVRIEAVKKKAAVKKENKPAKKETSSDA